MKNKFKKIVAVGAVIVGIIYILNPTMGLFELLPDNLPIVGNLDEAAAVYMILLALRYLGLDLIRSFDLGKKKIDK